jgi:hypothetical protein
VSEEQVVVVMKQIAVGTFEAQSEKEQHSKGASANLISCLLATSFGFWHNKEPTSQLAGLVELTLAGTLVEEILIPTQDFELAQNAQYQFRHLNFGGNSCLGKRAF